MSDLHFRRDHSLGLARAREVALEWAEHVEQKLEMECTIYEGEDSDTVEFTRSGAKGQMLVAADHFEISAKLGLMLKPFAGMIRAEAERQLDEALAHAAAKGR